ncbi:hypothetical protein EV196_102129 [Mariniflexile fucanivorans]|uniref:SH3 domain-containing protein n=1 Tax=Mariniflexile fucanivorans TaxID=264023 RepID=A0A4R1RMQ7_9FLAO|nr:hypothetical protein [Mariniflexile fucanivorans]TCL67573.1 hypothetical protein EV196_102129 [Mariniflexile fucanivorans]
MKQVFTLILLLYFSNSFGQFAIVNDKDNVVNVREDGVQNSKVIDKLQNGHLIYCFENKGDWTNIDYENKGKELNGYVYSNIYKLISSFPALTISEKSENLITLKNDTIEVIISQSKFDKKKHVFKYVKDYTTQIELIDNKRYWGLDGGMPKTQFEKISIKIGHKYITLPKFALDGLYEPNIYTAEVNYDNVTGTFYIQTMNSDGAGGYLVMWKIEKGIYKERFVVHGF